MKQSPNHLAIPLLLATCAICGFSRAGAQVQPYAGKYIIASIALPGAGEMWQGQKTKGEIFLWVDGVIWLTYGGMTAIGGSRNQSAKLFAGRNSGSSMAQRSDDYYVALERYANSDLYNEDIRREARELYPNDPDRQKTYSTSHGYFGDATWNWGSDSLRFDYWRQRKSARSVLHTAGFILGAALVNRLASAIDVAFFSPVTGEKRVGVVPGIDQPGLAVVWRF